MDELRFCLIGAGRAGMVHARNLVHHIKGARLTAIVDSDEKVLAERGEELGVEGLYAGLDDALGADLFDAAVIVTPTFSHRDMVAACARAGKHVFCEKPMSITVDQARDMNRAVREAGVKLQIGFMRRFDPPFVRARELIEEGSLGEVVIIKSVGRGPGLPPPWTYDVSESNGLLGEVNSHDFDSTRWLAGGEYRRVYAEAVNRKVPDLKREHPDFYDNVVCAVRFHNQVLATIDGTCPADYGYDARTEIVMTGGMISVGETRGEALFSCDVHGTVRQRAFKSWRNRFKEAYIEEMRSFIDCVVHDREPRVTGRDGQAAVAVVVAANRSIRAGVPVELEEAG
jgi:myo-inositol 2-dehydrogenase/D-chiro-inositol 1-dehydrogenase/scyllo-inositol 2-dehydrogenase (NAD+)